MRPLGSTRYSASGMKKECSLDMCVRLSSNEDDMCAQKRQCSGESRDRAAAIFSSSVPSPSSSKSSASGCPNVECVGGAGSVVSAEVSGLRSVGRGWSTRDRDLASFSRCFLESICERYAFSVVYALLMTFSGHSLTAQRRATHLQISQVVPLGDNATAVSCLLSSTFWLKTAALTGGSDATRRFMLYLW